MIKIRYILFIMLTGFLSAISVDVSLGEALNFKQQVKINDSTFEAAPKTKGFKNPQYYSIRLRSNKLEFELIHHKLYFDEGLPDYIKHFELTDGYNLVMLNYISPFIGNLNYRLGVGVPVVHPDITIQGDFVNLEDSKRIFERGGGLIPQFWKDGYYPGGFTSQIGLFYIKRINDKISYHLETKAVYATTQFDLNYIDDDSSSESNLDISIPNLSIHFLTGISFGK